jgi:hypothetical protein
MAFLRLLATALLASAAVACDKGAGSAPQPAPEPATSAPAPTAAASASASKAATAGVGNDGTDPKAPALSPDDVGFQDGRRGAGWGDRCFEEIKAGKWGWAQAACDRGLALSDVDPKVQPLLLYNEGLIAKHAGAEASARDYFVKSLALRAPDDPGRATVEKALESVGGKPVAAPKGTYKCEDTRCRAEQICCPGGNEPHSAYCTDYDPNSPKFCRLTFRMCDPGTNQPCVSPERCQNGPEGPQHGNLVCAP